MMKPRAGLDSLCQTVSEVEWALRGRRRTQPLAGPVVFLSARRADRPFHSPVECAPKERVSAAHLITIIIISITHLAFRPLRSAPLRSPRSSSSSSSSS